jgi:hypothetical protein
LALTAAVVVAGFGLAGSAAGISIGALHCGHLPRLPANSSFTFIVCEHFGQVTEMDKVGSWGAGSRVQALR